MLAVIFALPPLVYLASQVAASERHHLQSLKNSRRQSEALAASVMGDVKVIRSSADNLAKIGDKRTSKTFEKRPNELEIYLEVAGRQIDFLDQIFRGQVLCAMEMQINPVDNPHRLIILRRIALVAPKIKAARNKPFLTPEELEDLQTIMKLVDRVRVEVLKWADSAQKVIEEYNKELIERREEEG